MDRFSHIALAKGLLKVAKERTDMAYLSILPLVDGSPSFLHRLHCHAIVRAPIIVEAAKKVFGTTGKQPNIDNSCFEVVRITQEKHQFIKAFETTSMINGNESMRVDDGYGALLSILSHTYFDTYNNAVQAFVPYEGYCAGQYEMWNKIDDYFTYRIKWYRQTAPEFRIKVFNDDFWDCSFTAKELVKGMIHRIAEYTKPNVSLKTIEKVEKDLNVSDVEINDKVISFYKSLEVSIEKTLLNGVNSLQETPNWEGDRVWVPIH